MLHFKKELYFFTKLVYLKGFVYNERNKKEANIVKNV